MADVLALIPALSSEEGFQLDEKLWDQIAKVVLIDDQKLPRDNSRSGSVLSEYQMAVNSIVKAFSQVQYQGKYAEKMWEWTEAKLKEQITEMKEDGFYNGSQCMVVFASMMESIATAEHKLSARYWTLLDAALKSFLRGLITGSVQGPGPEELYFIQRLEVIEQFAEENAQRLDAQRIYSSC